MVADNRITLEWSRVMVWRLFSILAVSLGLSVVKPSPIEAQSSKSSLALLEELTNAHGPSGFEGPVRKIMRREWASLVSNLETDGMGNLLGTLKGTTEGPRVLLMAHMDEVGFIVRFIDDDGFIYFNPVGGYFDQSILTQQMKIMTPKGPVIGYTGMKSGHSFQGDERNQMVELRDVFLDIGARSRLEAEDIFGIRPGLPITYDADFRDLNGTGRYLAKAWDDRAGLAAITEVLQRLQDRSHPNTVVVAATTQEEISGRRGASVVYESLKPDIVLNLEIGVASDFPLLTSPKEAQGQLGGGPSLFVFDGSMLPNQKLIEWIMEVADRNGIDYQFESVSGYGEDASVLQRSGRGIPAINLGITTRYAHSQLGVVELTDYEKMVDLLHVLVMGLTEEQAAAIRDFDS